MWYRIPASRDAFISNKSLNGTQTALATGSNTGLSPSTQIFALKNKLVTGSIELARALYQFDITELSGKIFDEKAIPSSSVSYFLRLNNVVHDKTVPTSYQLYVYPLSRSWTEGSGSDVFTFRDYGWTNWLSASSTQTWTLTGSDYLSGATSAYGSGSQSFDIGNEDLEINVTQIVNNWLTSSIGLAGGLPNNGVVVKLGNTEENNSTDYYLKSFYSRQSKFVDRLPFLEARWDSDVIRDNRNNFAYDNDSSLYFYNFVRGQLKNVSEPVLVRIRDHVIAASASYNVTITASVAVTGVYSASFNISNTSSFSSSWVDVWFSGSRVYMSATFVPLILTGTQVDQYTSLTVNANVKEEYSQNEQDRVKVVVRRRQDKTLHLRTIHSGSVDIDKEYIEEMYYSLVNDENGEVIIPFSTGSVKYSRLSYDKDGNYFNMFFNALTPGFVYRLKFLIVYNKSKTVIDTDYKFKIVG